MGNILKKLFNKKSVDCVLEDKLPEIEETKTPKEDVEGQKETKEPNYFYKIHGDSSVLDNEKFRNYVLKASCSLDPDRGSNVFDDFFFDDLSQNNDIRGIYNRMFLEQMTIGLVVEKIFKGRETIEDLGVVNANSISDWNDYLLAETNVSHTDARQIKSSILGDGGCLSKIFPFYVGQSIQMDVDPLNSGLIVEDFNSNDNFKILTEDFRLLKNKYDDNFAEIGAFVRNIFNARSTLMYKAAAVGNKIEKEVDNLIKNQKKAMEYLTTIDNILNSQKKINNWKDSALNGSEEEKKYAKRQLSLIHPETLDAFKNFSLPVNYETIKDYVAKVMEGDIRKVRHIIRYSETPKEVSLELEKIEKKHMCSEGLLIEDPFIQWVDAKTRLKPAIVSEEVDVFVADKKKEFEILLNDLEKKYSLHQKESSSKKKNNAELQEYPLKKYWNDLQERTHYFSHLGLYSVYGKTASKLKITETLINPSLDKITSSEHKTLIEVAKDFFPSCYTLFSSQDLKYESRGEIYKKHKKIIEQEKKVPEFYLGTGLDTFVEGVLMWMNVKSFSRDLGSCALIMPYKEKSLVELEKFYPSFETNLEKK